ncbi:MAG: hypothetical protein AB8B82_06860 [Roseovarius sp.]
MTQEWTQRERVWIALSDLFLDTDVTLSFDYVERTILGSPFDMATIDLILRDEVAPVCLFNLYDLAGEWAAFHEDWLIPAIQSYLRRPAWRRRLGRATRTREIRLMVPEWPGLRARIEAKRTQAFTKGNKGTRS